MKTPNSYPNVIFNFAYNAPHPSFQMQNYVDELRDAGFRIGEEDTVVDEATVEHILRLYFFMKKLDDYMLIKPEELADHFDMSRSTPVNLFSPMPNFKHYLSSATISTGSNQVDNYTSSQVIAQAMNRKFEIVEIRQEDVVPTYKPTDIAIAEFINDGHSTAFIKRVNEKDANWRIDLYDDDFADTVAPGNYGYFHNPVYLMQEEVHFTDEYRFFVIDGEIITGAPRVLRHNPLLSLNKSENPFADSFCGEFDDSDTQDGHKRVYQDTAKAMQYRAFARETIEKLREEKPHWTHYTLDVGTMRKSDGTDSIAVVELNSITNAGMFSAQVENIVTAQIRKPITGTVQSVMSYLTHF